MNHLRIKFLLLASGLVFLLGCKSPQTSKEAVVPIEAKAIQSDWLYWRGPAGTGVSEQTALPSDFNGSLLWTHDIQGGGVPVIAGGRAYQFGYYGVEDDCRRHCLF